MMKSQTTLRSILRVLPVVCITALLAACGTPQKSAKNSSEMHSDSLILKASQDEFEKLVKNADIKSKILDQFADWEGVRYRLGGNSKRGIDCSGFVQRTFREQFGVELPRSTSEQQGMGKQIDKNRLKVGDLVMFRAGSTGKHIGIYIGNDKFVHASTSKGVMISSMSENYWKNRYRTARRVLSGGNDA